MFVFVLMFVFAAVRLLFASASSLVDRAISPFGPVQSDGGGGGAAAAVAARSRRSGLSEQGERRMVVAFSDAERSLAAARPGAGCC